MASPLPPELERLLAASDPAGLDSAWSVFLQSYNGVLLRAARAVGPEHDGAMDRYAHVLEQLRSDRFRRLRQCAAHPPEDFGCWLGVVARRISLDHYRARYGRARPMDSPHRSDDRRARRRVVDLLASGVDVELLLDDRQRAPDEDMALRERNAALAAALQDLSDRDRLLLRFRFDEGCTATEISRLMDFPTPFHVYRRLNAVLARLRAALEQRGFDGA